MEIKIINIEDDPFLLELYSQVEYETIGGTREGDDERKVLEEYFSG
jgi:hypothetical protein